MPLEAPCVDPKQMVQCCIMGSPEYKYKGYRKAERRLDGKGKKKPHMRKITALKDVLDTLPAPPWD